MSLGGTFGSLGETLKVFGNPLEDLWGSFGLLGGPLGVIWGLLGSLLGILWAPGWIWDDSGTVSGGLLGSKINVFGKTFDEFWKNMDSWKVARRRTERLVLEA